MDMQQNAFGYALKMELIEGIGTGVKNPGAKFSIAGIKIGNIMTHLFINTEIFKYYVDSDDKCVP